MTKMQNLSPYLTLTLRIWRALKGNLFVWFSGSRNYVAIQLRVHSITTWTRWGGQKMYVFVHAQGIKTVHAGRGGQKKAKFCPRSCWMTPYPPEIDNSTGFLTSPQTHDFSCILSRYLKQKIENYFHCSHGPYQYEEKTFENSD